MEYLSPGVYLEEVDRGPKPIEGVSTSTAGMVGMTVRGPTTGLPVLVTSLADYMRRFGGYLPETLGTNRFLPFAVRGFFENEGKRVYITRVKGTGSNPATDGGVLTGGLVTRLTRDVTAVPATTVRLASLRGVQAGATLTFTQVIDGVTTAEGPVTVAAYDDSTGDVTFAPAINTEFRARHTAVEVDLTGVAVPPASLATAVGIRAGTRQSPTNVDDPGAWGNSLQVQIRPTSRTRSQVQSLSESVPASGNFDTVTLASTANFYRYAVVEFDQGDAKVWRKVTEIQGSSLVVDPPFAAATDLDPGPVGFTTTAATCEFIIAAAYGNVTERWGPLTLDDRTPFFYEDVINRQSNLLRVTGGSDNASTDPFTMPTPPNGLGVSMVGGSDGTAPTNAAYVGTDNGPEQRTGIQAMIDIDEVSIVAVPGITSQTVQSALVTHCEALKDRFAILDPDYTAGATAIQDIRSHRNLYDTKYAALYFPRLRVYDPISDSQLIVPPSGHMAGIYARTDNTEGVHKAPANTVIRGITELEHRINKGEQDILNPDNINVLRDFRDRQRGLRVWGARCLTSDAAWKYVPVRRLFIFLEESLEEGTQDFVFDPNDEPLWGRLRRSVSIFLTRVWRDGALMGTTPEEAFYVKCDRTTMSTDDILNGRLVMEIGVAPVRPAEFIIIRISQWLGGSDVEEI